MSDGCPGCIASPQGQAIELQNAIIKATAHAKEKHIPTAIYKEGGEYKICDAFYAYANQYPVERVVSVHYATTP